MTRRRARTLTALAVVALMIVSAAPAGATVIERGRYSFDFSDVYADCGYEVEVTGGVSGHFRIRAGKGKTDTAFFVRDNYSFTETHTNVETGAFLTIEGNAVFTELRATRVAGNVFEFASVEAGQPFVVYDSAGKVVLRDRGSLYQRILFDTGGDDVPGGDVVAELGTDIHGPHPAFGAEHCDIIDPLIGPSAAAR